MSLLDVVETDARELAARVMILRPSERRHLSSNLNTPQDLLILEKAIAFALSSLPSPNDEILERVFSFGMQMRKVLEDGRTAGLKFSSARWDDVHPRTGFAFVEGFNRQPFEAMMNAVRGITTERDRSTIMEALEHSFDEKRQAFEAEFEPDAEDAAVLGRSKFQP